MNHGGLSDQPASHPELDTAATAAQLRLPWEADRAGTVDAALQVALAVVDRHGWVSRDDDVASRGVRVSTAELVRRALHGTGDPADRLRDSLRDTITRELVERAAAVREWGIRHAAVTSSRYYRDLAAALDRDTVGDGRLALVVSAVSGYTRDQQQEREQRIAANSQWQGSVGERLRDLTVTVVSTSDWRSRRGPGTRVRFVDEAGHVYVWLTTKLVPELTEGSELEFGGTVAEHVQWGGAKETRLSRVSYHVTRQAPPPHPPIGPPGLDVDPDARALAVGSELVDPTADSHEIAALAVAARRPGAGEPSEDLRRDLADRMQTLYTAIWTGRAQDYVPTTIAVGDLLVEHGYRFMIQARQVRVGDFVRVPVAETRGGPAVAVGWVRTRTSQDGAVVLDLDLPVRPVTDNWPPPLRVAPETLLLRVPGPASGPGRPAWLDEPTRQPEQTDNRQRRTGIAAPNVSDASLTGPEPPTSTEPGDPPEAPPDVPDGAAVPVSAPDTVPPGPETEARRDVDPAPSTSQDSGDTDQLVGFSPVEQAVIREAVQDHAYKYVQLPGLGRSPANAARYVTEGHLDELTERYGLGPVWEAVAAVIASDLTVLDYTLKQAEEVREARHGEAARLDNEAFQAFETGRYGRARRLLREVEVLSPSYVGGIPFWDRSHEAVSTRERETVDRAELPGGDPNDLAKIHAAVDGHADQYADRSPGETAGQLTAAHLRDLAVEYGTAVVAAVARARLEVLTRQGEVHNGLEDQPADAAAEPTSRHGEDPVAETSGPAVDAANTSAGQVLLDIPGQRAPETTGTGGVGPATAEGERLARLAFAAFRAGRFGAARRLIGEAEQVAPDRSAGRGTWAAVRERITTREARVAAGGELPGGDPVDLAWIRVAVGVHAHVHAAQGRPVVDVARAVAGEPSLERVVGEYGVAVVTAVVSARIDAEPTVLRRPDPEVRRTEANRLGRLAVTARNSRDFSQALRLLTAAANICPGLARERGKTWNEIIAPIADLAARDTPAGGDRAARRGGNTTAGRGPTRPTDRPQHRRDLER